MSKRWFNLIALLVVMVTLLISLFNFKTIPVSKADSPSRVFLPFFPQYPQPLTSTSYYMTTINSEFVFNLGCALGLRDLQEEGQQDSVAVLDFSYPICEDETGEFGAELFGAGPVDLDDVSSSVKDFALGYYHCSGSDNESNLVIGVGTNNKPYSCDTHEKATDHGAAWSRMVKSLNRWASNQGILHQVQVYGASDIELGWNSPGWTRAWLAGFEQTNGNFMLHFGDAAGCPYDENPHWSCGTSKFPEWTVEDVWFVSWGSPSALPLPLIYLTNGVHAKQWAYLSQYSDAAHGQRMDFTGVFTQWDYCQHFTWCSGIDNTPFDAYNQLYSELNNQPATAQELRWKTDIHWIMQSELEKVGNALVEPFTPDSPHPIQKEIKNLQQGLMDSSLSLPQRNSLVFKLQRYQSLAEMIDLSQKNPAEKDPAFIINLPHASDPEFQTGIMNHGTVPGLPYGAELNNTWQTQTENGFLQIGAGSTSDNPPQGALFIVRTALDKSVFESTLILAPIKCSSFTIVEERLPLLLLKSDHGKNFTLDVDTLTLQESSP